MNCNEHVTRKVQVVFIRHGKYLWALVTACILGNTCTASFYSVETYSLIPAGEDISQIDSIISVQLKCCFNS